MHALDRPIWNALHTQQATLAQTHGDAVRFDPQITQLAACARPDGAALADLAALLAPGEVTGLLFDDPPALPSALERVDVVAVAQMLHEDAGAVAPARIAPPAAYVTLGDADVPEMIALARLTRPGPFAERSHTLGTFLGVRDPAGPLVAMAGQRMRLPGFHEVSAVCTHPTALGRGLAAALVAEVVRRILAAGEAPFLHVRADNERAIALYRRLGFTLRRELAYVIVRRA